MTERMRESLSALLDDEANELEVERVLASIADDADLRQTWVRYNTVRAVVSGQQVGYQHLDVSAAVSEAINDIGQSSDAAAESRGLQRYLRPLASFAVAASVAATVVIGGQQMAQVGGLDSATSPGLANGVSPVGMVNSLGATPVRASFGTQPIPVLQPAASTAYQELARQRMQQYMQEHAEHAALNSPHGLIPFARVTEIKE